MKTTEEIHKERDERHKEALKFKNNRHTRHAFYKQLLFWTSLLWVIAYLSVGVYSAIVGDESYLKLSVKIMVAYFFYFMVLGTIILRHTTSLLNALTEAFTDVFLILAVSIVGIVFVVSVGSAVNWAFT